MSQTVDTDEFRATLLEERERVERAIANLRDDHPGIATDEVEDVPGSSDNHLAETATATLNREIDFTLEENSAQVLEEIDAALKRIEDGTYGTCSSCGKAIGHERLEAYPWAALCIDDARQAERR
jgi:DnaK suppressor protein